VSRIAFDSCELLLDFVTNQVQGVQEWWCAGIGFK
jgi:hypothetical protein